MNRLTSTTATLAALIIFCATLTYWVIHLSTPAPVPTGAATASNSDNLDSAATLFGTDRHDLHMRLSGILSLGTGRGAAAIVSLDGAPSRVIGIGQSIADHTTLSEVLGHSIIVEHNGVRSEVPMQAATAGTPGGVVYMR